MLPVGALCFYQAHFGHTMLPTWPLWVWVHLFCYVFHSVSELRRACFRQAHVAQAAHPPGASSFMRGLCASSLCPRIPHAPAPTFSGVCKRVVSKRVVSADVPPDRKPERGYVRQNHPFTKPPFYLPVTFGVLRSRDVSEKVLFPKKRFPIPNFKGACATPRQLNP